MKAAGSEEQTDKEDLHGEYRPSGEPEPAVRRVPERLIPCTLCRAHPSRTLKLTFLCPSEHLIHRPLLLSAHYASGSCETLCEMELFEQFSYKFHEAQTFAIAYYAFCPLPFCDISFCSVTEEHESQSFTITAMTSTTSSVLFVMPWPVPGGQIVTSPARTVLISPLSLYSAVPFMI